VTHHPARVLHSNLRLPQGNLLKMWSGTINGSNNLTAQTAYFYGVNGKLIGSYSLCLNYGAGQYLEFSDPPATQAVYFGGKRVGTTQSGTTTAYWQDRLGSNRNGAVLYYPWGEARGTNPQDTWNYATYWQDSATGLDYADQRYYGNVQGRFMTPDPYRATATSPSDPKTPQSWNRYAYVQGDPINYNDPKGQDLSSDFLSGGGGWWGCDSGYVLTFVNGIQMPNPCDFLPVFFAPAQPRITFECGLSLWATPILIPGTNTPIPNEFHTALVMTKVGFLNGTAISSVTYWLEAYPSPDYLNSGGPEPVPDNGNTALWKPFYNYGISASLCNQYTKAFNWATNYSNTENDTIPYETLGPNSNSWVSTLLSSVGLTVPQPPTWSPGWGQTVP
jgi:RHS repeat-associated protein